MNKRQLAEVKRVIDNDATGSSTLIDETQDGLTFCALGGMAKAAGMTNHAIRIAQANHEGALHDAPPYPTVAAAIQRKFGIAPKWVPKIFMVNDNFGNFEVPRRRVALKKLMDKIYAADQRAKA